MKKNSRIRKLICVCLCLCTAVSCMINIAPRSAMAQESEEETGRKVVVIETTDDFLAFAESCRLDSFSADLSVVLEKSIDLAGVEFDGIPIFSGTFDGGGNSITGLSLSGSGSVQGLFRYLGQTAVVRNLLVGGEIVPGGSRGIVGAVAGSNAGYIENCVFAGRVSGADSVGGIAGRNEMTGVIENCRVSGDIYGDHFVGGITGENLGVVRGCENSAQVNTTVEQNSVDISDITLESLIDSESAITVTDIGGIAGTSSGVIRECSNLGDVGYKHMGYNIGGIAGSQIGYITGSENHGSVSGRKEVGGIVGQMEPSTEIKYEADAMQILEGQLGQMSAMIDDTASSAQGSAESMQGQIGSMQSHIGNALEAMGQLMPDPSNPELPDGDSALAALNNLSGSLAALSSSLGGLYQTGQQTVDTLSDDFERIGEQLNAIGQTVSSASESMGGVIIDVSDDDTEEDVTGKLADCINYGDILADLNAGGITGSIAIENDFDHEADFYVTGNSSMNYECRARAVILRCANGGRVTAAKQNAGGIAGWMMLGLVSESMNTGAIDSTSADYVGGVCGQSQGFIRSSGSKSEIKGADYVGGIAGTAAIVTECRSMVRITAAREKFGAIVGYFGEDISPEGEELPMRGNYYLPVDKDIGGVDGISYDGIAQPLADRDFYALESLPEQFSKITVRFIFDDGSEKTVVLAPGGRLSLSDIPKIPEKLGYLGSWEGLDSVGLDEIRFDTAFPLVYVHMSTSVQSDEVRENGLPVMLVQGEFADTNNMQLVSMSDVPVSDEAELIEAWEFTLPESDCAMQLRYLLPEGYSAEDMRVFVRTASGDWREAAFTADKSYIVMAADMGDNAIRAEQVEENLLPQILIVAAGAVLLIGLAAVFYAVKKSKRKTEE